MRLDDHSLFHVHAVNALSLALLGVQSCRKIVFLVLVHVYSGEGIFANTNSKGEFVILFRGISVKFQRLTFIEVGVSWVQYTFSSFRNNKNHNVIFNDGS